MQYIAIDSFAPQHATVVAETLTTGHLPESADNAPLFYLFGSLAAITIGIEPSWLMFFPLQAIPYLALLYVLLWKISQNRMIAAGLVAMHFLSGLDGSSTLYYWPHGMGHILFLAFLISLLQIFGNYGPSRWSSNQLLMVMPIIIAIVLPWFSYNLWAIMTITVGTLFITTPLVRTGAQQSHRKRQFFSLAFLSAAAYLPLSKLVFGTAVPLILRSEDMSSLSKFISSWFPSSSARSTALSSVYFSRPSELTAIAGVKYAVLGLAILAVLLAIYHAAIFSQYQLSASAWVVHSAMVGVGGFMILRLFVGSLPIPWLHFAGLFGIALLARSHFTVGWNRMASSRRWFAAVAVVLLLVQAPLYYSVATVNDASLKTDGFEEEEAVSNFTGFYGSDRVIHTSVFMQYILQLFWVESGINQQATVVMSTEDVIELRHGDAPPSGYWIFNYELNYVALMNWVSLDSWKESKAHIQSNRNVDKIYSGNESGIYMAI